MKINFKLLVSFLSILAISIFTIGAKKDAPVNEKCPFSSKAVKADKVVSFNVCCNNCAKKASSDLKSFIKKTKAGNKECPFSGKPAKKKVQVAFCCGNCVSKASS